MSEKHLCRLCGEPMPEGEEMFKYHGYSCNCPKPPLEKSMQIANGNQVDLKVRKNFADEDELKKEFIRKAIELSSYPNWEELLWVSVRDMINEAMATQAILELRGRDKFIETLKEKMKKGLKL